MVIEHVVDGDERHARLCRQMSALAQSRTVIAAIEHACCKPHAAAGRLAQQRQNLEFLRERILLFACDELQLRAGTRGGLSVRVRGGGSFDAGSIPRRSLHHNEFKALDMRKEIVEMKNAISFLGTQVAACEQAA